MFEVSRYLPRGSGGCKGSGETHDDGVFVGDAVGNVDFLGGEVVVEFDGGGEFVAYFDS